MPLQRAGHENAREYAEICAGALGAAGTLARGYLEAIGCLQGWWNRPHDAALFEETRRILDGQDTVELDAIYTCETDAAEVS